MSLKRRFLMLFREFRASNGLIGDLNVQLANRNRLIAEQKATTSSMLLKLGESERGLSIMTEARVNADRELSILRGELDAMRDMHTREIENFKQFIDFFSLGGTGRQVFGKMAENPLPKDDEPERPSVISARAATERLKNEFFEKMMATGGQPPRDPELDEVYSSTGSAESAERDDG